MQSDRSRGAVVGWLSRRTVDQKVCGSRPAAALMSFSDCNKRYGI